MGVTFALASLRLHRFLIRQCHFSETHSAAVICIIFLAAIFSILGVTGVKISQYAQDSTNLLREIELLKTQLSEVILTLARGLRVQIDDADVARWMAQAAEYFKELAAEFVEKILKGVAGTVFKFFIFLLTIFVVISNYRLLLFTILTSHKVSKKNLWKLQWTVSDLCREVVFTSFLTGLVQATLVAISAALFSDMDPVLFFVISFSASFIPLVGASPSVGLLAFLEWIQGNQKNGVILFVIMFAVGLCDNVIRAFLMAKRGMLATFFNLLACLGGIYFLGVSGVFLGPLLINSTLRLVPILLNELRQKKAGQKRRL